MPIVKNRKGNEIVEISNLSEISVTTDGMETLQTTTNTTLSSIDSNINSSIGEINNTGAMGDSSNKLQVVTLGYDRVNGKGVSFLIDSSGRQQIIDVNLESSIGAIDNTGAIGDASNKLQSVCLGYDRTNGKGVSFLVDSSGRQQIIDVNLESSIGAINNSGAIGDGSNRLQSVCLGYDRTNGRGVANLVDSTGRQVTISTSNRSSETDIVSSTFVTASSQIGSNIDIGLKKSIIIIGQGSANHSFYLEHSNDNTNWYLNTEVSPVSHSGNYHFNVKVEDSVRYYRLMNGGTANTLTLKYITL